MSVKLSKSNTQIIKKNRAHLHSCYITSLEKAEELLSTEHKIAKSLETKKNTACCKENILFLPSIMVVISLLSSSALMITKVNFIDVGVINVGEMCAIGAIAVQCITFV